ncbi:pimeloyl-ACP methyl ester carboxylesterase [Saccharothrix coeruleofusca]|uniref:alpha/beta fold hydrolase n=1 Tax=Saccharothrix coeruleofusca TaxID=33919 RepID=UPI001AE7486A|nr:alpha/beta hydrolase [Saccharothrix coeruleofusca]MBP2334108.1 pimeloyl-ACP methyl ester carboxylesterase [Saccharothrix coeruleofusca]
MRSTTAQRFTHEVTSTGAGRGMVFTGLRRTSGDTHDVPLIVALHGGGYTSAYFDVPGYSLLDRAAGAGVPVIAVDRPGYGGSTPVPLGDSPYLANAATVDHLIGELWQTHGAGTAGIVLVGHSIGAQVALAIAGGRPRWPLLGLSVSGCLLRHGDGFAETWAAAPGTYLDVSVEEKAELMFGPEWTRRDDMPRASFFANVPVLTAELTGGAGWEKSFRDLAPEITVPVQLRHGRFDPLWGDADDQIPEFVAGLESSPWIDAAAVPAAGHAIDYHRVGAAFHAQQLAFALTCAAQTISGP